MATIVMATFAYSDFAVVFQLFPVVLNASSTVRHVNYVHYSVCAHTMFLKHNVCSFVSPTSMAKKTRRVLTWRGWSFLHTPLAKVCTRENDKQPCIRETKYTRKKVLLGQQLAQIAVPVSFCDYMVVVFYIHGLACKMKAAPWQSILLLTLYMGLVDSV